MFSQINFNEVFKAILSDPKKNSNLKKAVIKRILIKDKEMFQIETFTTTKAFQKNVDISLIESELLTLMQNDFNQALIMTNDYQYGFRITSKNKVLSNKKKVSNNFVTLSHNKEKSYLLKEGEVIPPLIDLGVMTQDGKVSKAHFDKYKQINKFLEILDDTLKYETKKHLNIIDFGCGKSYLTFIVYYFLTYVKGLDVTMTGLDLKEDVIKECNLIRDKYGYQNLHFEMGDISLYEPKEYCDMIITLHACDTATDFAMYHAIMLKTKYLLSVPCCQHELNLSLKKDHFHLITKYGLLKDRFCAILTDSIRANLLECFGYKVQAVEFVDFMQSPKNIMIKAIKTTDEINIDIKNEVKALLDEYHVHQTLYDLLFKEKN